MYKTALYSLGLALAATSIAAPAEAGPFDKLKKAAKKVEKKAREAEQVADTVDRASRGQLPVSRSRAGVGASADGSYCNANKGSNSNSPCTAKGLGHAGRAGPAPAKYTGLTKCAGLPISNAFIGQWGKYSFSSGINTEERSGIIDRENVSATLGCITPSMGTGDVLYMEVPASQLKSLSGGFEMQCVDMASGKQANDAARPSWNNVTGKDIMLHTGNSLGYTPTASGSNSDRSGAWDADLKKRGKAMLGFNMPALHTDAGTDFYCQYYNKGSGKSVVAFAYRRSAGA